MTQPFISMGHKAQEDGILADAGTDRSWLPDFPANQKEGGAVGGDKPLFEPMGEPRGKVMEGKNDGRP